MVHADPTATVDASSPGSALEAGARRYIRSISGPPTSLASDTLAVEAAVSEIAASSGRLLEAVGIAAEDLPNALTGERSAQGVAERALQDSEEKYRMLLDGIQDHAIYMLDPTGLVISWNAGAERIKGYTAEEVLGQSYARFFPEHQIGAGRPEELLRLTAAAGRHEEQSMRVRKDRSQFLASLTLTALRDTSGNLQGFAEFSHDLSESKKSEARYRGLLEAAPDAMVVVNQAGDIVLLNAQAENQFGYRRDELIGQQVTNVIPEGFRRALDRRRHAHRG